MLVLQKDTDEKTIKLKTKEKSQSKNNFLLKKFIIL